MNVYKIAHAGLIVDAGGVRCLMDPVLFEPFECRLNLFEPRVAIDVAGLRHVCDVIVLSHAHGDHFCLQSLNELDRACPVVFPSGCDLIERALAAMGFQRLRPLAPGERVRFGGLELTATPSDVSFPEMGVLFVAAGYSFWNCVDTELGDRAFAIVRQQAPRLDLMFATYQVLLEEELGCDALGAAFPFDRYARRLLAVRSARPRCVVPASCGYRYVGDPWMNQRGFPVTEREFLDDVRRIEPEVVSVSLPPGGMIDVTNLAVHAAELRFVEATAPITVGVLDWRPDRGVPPLRDEDPFGHGAGALGRELSPYLDGEFLAAIEHASAPGWRDRLAAGEVVWQLDVVYPDGRIDERWLDFARAPAAWLAAAPRPPKLITSICASTIAGLRSGEVATYRAVFTRRVVQRLYSASRDGLQRVGGLADEPIARILFRGADARHIDFELARLGYRSAPWSATPPTHGIRGVRTLPRPW